MKILKEDFLNITNKNSILISYSSPYVDHCEAVLLPVSKPRFSEKYNLHKLTCKNSKNLGGAKFYAYLKDERIDFAFSNSPITIKTISIK